MKQISKILSAALLSSALVATQQASAQIGTTVTINVTNNATVSGLSNQTYCSGASATAQSFTGSTGADSFQISGGATVGLNNQTVTTASIPSFTAATSSSSDLTATITVTPYDNGCAGTPSTYTVTIPATPTATAPTNATVCADATVSATPFTAANADSFQISGGAAVGLANQTITTAEIPSFTAASSAVSATTITITPYNNGCAGTPVTYTITVTGTPTVDDISGVIACGGSTAAVDFTGTASSFTWTNDNTAIGLAATGTGDISGTYSNTITTQQVANIVVTPNAGTCTGSTKTFTITLNPLPNGSLSTPDADICASENAQLTFTSTAGTAPFSIEYSVNGGSNVTESISTSPSTFNTTSPSASNSYQLMKITDDKGCVRQ